MSNRILQFLCVISLSVFSCQASADDDFWIGARAGSLGLGLEATWQALPYLDFRAGVNRYDYDDNRSEAGVDYEATLQLDSLYATANLRVPLSPFRITGGVFANDNSLVLLGRGNGTVNLGGIDYDTSDVGNLRGYTHFEDKAPYAGVGFDFRLMNTLALTLDFGVLWQGDATVELAADGPLAIDPLFQAQLEAERTQLEEAMKDFKAYPVVAIGLSVNF